MGGKRPLGPVELANRVWKAGEMEIEARVEQFLQTVHEAASPFSGLKLGDDLVPLYHPFWTPDEIASGRAIKADWDVPDEMVPFYGDWHDLLCISVATGEVVLMDDGRATIFAWKSSDDFLSCLATHPEMEIESPASTFNGIIEDKSWLDF